MHLKKIFVIAVMIFLWSSVLCSADDLSPYYKFSGVKAPDSPYKNTWGAFHTDLFSGSFGYEYKFSLPPGINGFMPKLSLRYNSHSARGKAGWVGSGWEIPANYIQRDINYTRKDTSDDKFELHLDGAKHDLVFVAAENRYHTKNESYLKIERRTDNSAPNSGKVYWVVTSTGGTQYRFGYNLDSENMVNKSDSSMTAYVWRWSLDQITDTNGNHIYYSYQENPTTNDRGAVYLKSIKYNNDQKRIIEFVLDGSDKPDMYLTIDQGSEVREARRLSEIKVSLNTSLVRKYKFTYATNESKNKSLLASITEYGADGVSSLPPVKFSYNTMNKRFGSATTWSTPGERWIRKIDDDNDVIVDVLDLNGDGLPDLASFDDDHWDIWFNNKAGFNSSNVKWTAPKGGEIRSVAKYLEGQQSPDTVSSPMDINRDGYIDFLYAEDSSTLNVQKNAKGTGFSSAQSWSLPVTASIREVQRPDDKAANVKQDFLDMNGDGLPDLVKRVDDYHWHIWRNTGSGFADYGTWTVFHSRAWLEDYTRDVANLQVGRFDMNGDGLPDIADSADGDWKIYLNTGSNFIYAGTWPTKYSGLITDIDSTGNVKRDLIDINGDGLPDIVNPRDGSGSWEVQFNTGKGFTPIVTWSSSITDGYTRDVTRDGYVARDLLDINGDGLVDIVRHTSDDWKVYSNLSGTADLLTKVTDTLGGTISINYLPSVKFNNTRLPFNYWVVSSMTTNNGMSGSHAVTATTNYTYSGGLYDFPTREFRGFAKVTETRADGSKVAHSYHQDEAKKGKEYKTETLSSSSAIFASISNTFSESSSNGVYTSNLTRTEEATHDGVASGPRRKAKEYQDYDDYGNVRLEIDYGDVDDFTDDNYEYREFWSPCTPDTSWLMNRLKHKYILWGAGGTKHREIWLWYDDSTSCVSKGNLTKEMLWLNSGSNPVSTYQYDSYGNRTSSTDPQGRTTRTTYDATYHTFPEVVYNPLNQAYRKTFNPVNGQPIQETDPNGFTTKFVYDTFQRKVKEIRPYDSETLPTTSIQYLIDGVPPEGVLVKKRETSGGGGTLDTVQYVDGFGSLIQTKSEHENPGSKILQDVFYDSMGRVKKTSNFYLGGSSNSYSSPNTGTAGTNYGYDPLGRPTLITNPDGTTRLRVFDHWTVTETDENGHAKSYAFNARNNLTRVVENNVGDLYTTHYAYNILGELLAITDQLGNGYFFGYDTLGRKTFMNDPDLGIRWYLYDLVGNLTHQYDARGTWTSFLYDALNRKKAIFYNTTQVFEFTYDTNTIGTLAKVKDSLGAVDYRYDQRLRKVAENRTMDGKTFTTLWNYDSLDRATRMTYPDGKSIDYVYNGQGKLDSVSGMINNIDYNAQGQTILKSYASGKSTTLTYHSTNQRLLGMTTPELQNLSYGYDNAGNIKSIADGIAGRTENFTYDGLDRLVQAGDSGYSVNYQYDALGNMLSMVKDGKKTTYSYSGTGGIGSRPHAVNTATGPFLEIGSMVLNNGDHYALESTVTINNITFGNPTHYMASEDGSFAGASWQPYSTAPSFTLSPGYGIKTVYFKVRNADGESDVKNDSIIIVEHYPLDDSAPLMNSIVIDANPDNLNAPWTLTGPDGFSLGGTGDVVLHDLPSGDYMLTWGDSSGWVKPWPVNSCQPLTSGGTAYFTGEYAVAGILDQWQIKAVGSDSLMGVAYSPGLNLFAAVGGSGTILTSTDGGIWTPRTSGTMNTLEKIVYGIDKFIAVGSAGTILTSVNGINWVPASSGTGEQLYGIACSTSLCVAVGEGGTLLTSPDGTSWTPVTSGTTNMLYGAGYGNGLFVALGAYNTILTSPNGVNWTPQESHTPYWFWRAAHGNGNFVALGSEGVFLTSSNGADWIPYFQGTCTSTELTDIRFINGLFMAVGPNGTMLSSATGAQGTWQLHSTGTTLQLESLAYGNHRMVLVGQNGTILVSGTFKGTASIEVTPPGIDAPWNLTGPSGYNYDQSGDHHVILTETGNYTLTWGDTANWRKPSPAQVTQVLTDGGTLTFRGYYVSSGTVVIDAKPDIDVNATAPWMLTGPNGFSQSGTGDAYLDNLDSGNYTLTWQKLAGWKNPDPATSMQSLAADDTITFTGTYRPPMMGDVNGDDVVDLRDAIIVFQIMMGMHPADAHYSADVDGDRRIGLAEAIYILQMVSGMR